MEIELKCTCPKCNNEIRLYTKNKCEEVVKESNDAFFNFAKQSSLSVPDQKSENPFLDDIISLLLKNQKSSPKKLVKHFFNNYTIKIKGTKDKKELEKIKKRLLKARLRVSKQVKDEFDKNKDHLLKKVERKIAKKNNKERK